MRKVIVCFIALLSLCTLTVPFIHSPSVYAGSGNYTSTADDVGFLLVGSIGGYGWAWNATTIYWPSSYRDPFIIGQDYSTVYSIGRAALYFDTSDIPSLASIVEADLSLYMLSPDDSDSDYNVTIQSGMPTYPHLPFIDSDVNRLYYSGDGGSVNTSTLTINSYFTISLNATGIGWVNRGGYTKFILRSSKDIAGVAPTGTEMIRIASRDTGLSFAPVLYVTWIASTNPVFYTNPATYVTMSSARISGVVTSDGGDACDVELLWRKVGELVWNTSVSNPPPNGCDGFTGVHTGDILTCDLSGLSSGTDYEFVAYGNNGPYDNSGTANVQTFTTGTSCGNISDIHADPSACYINLTWTRPGDCEDTVIRYMTGGCPVNNSSGIEIYNGSGSSFTHDDLIPGTNYYYLFYGYSGGYWGNYSDCTMSTTLAGSCEGHVPISTGDDTTNWFLMTNASRMENFFLTPMINGIADDWGMPRNTFWLLLVVFILVVSSFLWYLVSHNPIWAAVWALILISLFGYYQLLPLWMDIIFGIACLGVALEGVAD